MSTLLSVSILFLLQVFDRSEGLAPLTDPE